MAEDDTKNLSDPLDTKPLIEQLAREMVATREMLLARFDGLEQRIDRFEEEVRKELRLVGDRLDLMTVEIGKTQAHVRGLDRRVTEIERKPA